MSHTLIYVLATIFLVAVLTNLTHWLITGRSPLLRIPTGRLLLVWRACCAIAMVLAAATWMSLISPLPFMLFLVISAALQQSWYIWSRP